MASILELYRFHSSRFFVYLSPIKRIEFVFKLIYFDFSVNIFYFFSEREILKKISIKLILAKTLILGEKRANRSTNSPITSLHFSLTNVYNNKSMRLLPTKRENCRYIDWQKFTSSFTSLTPMKYAFYVSNDIFSLKQFLLCKLPFNYRIHSFMLCLISVFFRSKAFLRYQSETFVCGL